GGRPRPRAAGGAAATAHAANRHALVPPHIPLQFISQLAPSLTGSAEQYDVSELGPLTDDPMIGMTGHAGPAAEAPPGIDPHVHQVQRQLVSTMTQKMGEVQKQMISDMEKVTQRLREDDDEDN
ncbi:MAG: hypothetical protein V4764_23545, partial [Burkholderia sp.]